MTANADQIQKTPLHSLHVALGGKMVPFAGYDMPVQFEGIMAEHNHVREAAGLFDVSHMGQVILRGGDAAAALETLVPGEIQALKPGRLRYSLFTSETGGILDDLMITRREDDLYLVVNAACKEADIAHLKAHLEPKGVTVEYLADRALMALQGPKAVATLERLSPGVGDLGFMTAGAFSLDGAACWISRSGYTGEDGVEISLPAADAERVARLLLDQPEVKPIGLGARDSLRLEAGLCLYGHDIDAATSPVEADLLFAINKRRREEGGFSGADVILSQIEHGVARRRVGLKLDGRQPAREGAEIADKSGKVIGRVTSGGFAPTVGGPIAMGYVENLYSAEGAAVDILVRGKALPATVAAMPFVPHRYYRKAKTS